MLHVIDRHSYLAIIIFAVLSGIIVALPVMYIVQRNATSESRLTGKYIRPTGVAVAEKQPPGPIPKNPPHIGRVFPWVGKIGDVVWIQGQHFGDNPTRKYLRIGGVEVKESGIMRWYDREIQAIIPTGARQGGIVEITVGEHAVTESVPFVLYDTQTQRKVSKQGTRLFSTHGGAIKRIAVWTGDERTSTTKKEFSIQPAIYTDTLLTDVGSAPILSILLYDSNGKVLPYYVDPLEFGF